MTNGRDTGGVILVTNTGGESMRMLAGLGQPLLKRVIPFIEKAPDIERAHGRAWECNFRGYYRKFTPEQVASDSTVATWIIEASYAHPIWHSYLLILVHLRGHPETTRFYRPDATHEFWLYALSQDGDRASAIAGEANPFAMALTPVNFAAQLACPTDDDAIAQIREAVEAVCAGTLNPDTDFRRQWIARFGDSMIRKGHR